MYFSSNHKDQLKKEDRLHAYLYKQLTLWSAAWMNRVERQEAVSGSL